MTDHEAGPTRPPVSSRGRLRRSGAVMVRVGAVLTVISLVIALLGGWATRGLLDHLQDNSVELLDGTATVQLDQGTQRTLYVTGGLISPGDDIPTPVELITCSVTGPGGPVAVADLAAQGQRVGIDTGLARFQVLGSFTTIESGEHLVECDALGVVVAPEFSPASALLRLGALVLGSLGTFLGLTLLLIGGALVLLVRRRPDEPEAGPDEVDQPPEQGAEKWWEEGDPGTGPDSDAAGDPAEDDAEDEADQDEDDYVDLTEEELAALSDEEIAAMLQDGSLVFVDDDEPDGTQART